MTIESEAHQRRRDIAASLAKEEATLAAIEESLLAADEMTKSMETILSNFGSRLGKLENAVVPIHRQTKDLQRLQDNTENVLAAIDKVVGYHHVAKRQRDVVGKGVQESLTKYLESLADVQLAVDFFAKNNPDSPELNHVRALFDKGKEKIDEFFQQQVRQSSKAPSPETIFEFLGTQKDGKSTLGPRIASTEGPKPVPIAEFEPSVTADLVKAANWMVNEAKYETFVLHFGQIRGNILHQALGQYKEFIKVNGSGTINAKGRTLTGRKSLTRKQSSILIRNQQAPKRRDRGGARGDDDSIDSEIEPFAQTIFAFTRLAEKEITLIKTILPENSYKKVFDLIVNVPLDSIGQDSKRFVQHVKECQVKKDYPGILTVFPTVEMLKKEQPEIHAKALKYCNDENRHMFGKLIRDIEMAGANALDAFVDGIKSDSKKTDENLPRDGTVHQMTSDALLFIEQLQVFPEVAGGMIATKKTDGSASAAQAKRAFGEYISKCCSAIVASLELRARNFEDPALKGLFLMNNFNFLINRLKKTEVYAIVEQYDKNIVTGFQSSILDHKSAYVNGWSRVVHHCSIDGVDLSDHKLREREKGIVKDRFKGFNAEIEDIVTKHQRWSVPDDRLRDQLRNEVIDYVKPHFSVFLKTFKYKEFTTKVNKYIKFTEQTLEDEIRKIFDREA